MSKQKLDRRPEAEIIIAVHDATRPVERAVQSVLDCPQAAVILVLHGLSAASLGITDADRIQLVSLPEKIGFPGAAFNAGIKAATADWVGVLGSDDWYEDGAIQAMLNHAKTDGADGILAPLRHPRTKRNTVKPVTWRRRNLDAVKDRLFYRTAPLGLFRRQIFQDPRYQFAEHSRAGVDQINSVRLWTDGLRISYYPLDPGYVVGDDAKERVTLAPRSVEVQGQMWREVWEDPEIRVLPLPVRQTLGEKIIKVHVFDWIKARPDAEAWHEGDLQWLADLVKTIEQAAPGTLTLLSSGEKSVLREMELGDFDKMQGEMRHLTSAGLKCHWRPADILRPSSPLRTRAAAVINRVREKLEVWSHKMEIRTVASKIAPNPGKQGDVPPRILAITPWWPTSVQPRSAPFMLRDVELLKKKNEVLVLHLCRPEELDEPATIDEGIRVVKVPYDQSRPETWLNAARTIRSLAKSADAVHTMAMSALLPTWIARIHKPWAHTEHYSLLVSEDQSRRQRAALAALKPLFSKPDEVIAVGDALREVINEYREIPATSIGNFVTIADSGLRSPDEELGSSPTICAVSVGGLIDRKGPLETIRAIAVLIDRGYDATLTWAGSGELYEQAQELAAELGISDRVNLLGGVSQESLWEELRRANVFILPTEAETFGVALAEALGHGLPVVTSGTGGHLEFLPDACTRVVQPRTGESLAAAVISLHSDENRMKSDEIIAYARTKFSDEVRDREYTEVYRRLFAGLSRDDSRE